MFDNKKPKPEKKRFDLSEKAWQGTKWLSRKTAKLIRDSALLARPLTKKEKFQLSKIEAYLNEKDRNRLINLIKQGKARVRLIRFGWSFLISGKDLLPRILFVKPENRKFNPDMDVEAKDQIWLEEQDKKIRKIFFESNFKEFSEKAWTAVPQFIAPNLVGLIEIKQAAALQLFSPEPVHILLLGDPGTGKTDIIRSSAELSPVSSFGLGSGTSGAGLAVTVQGKQVSPGLLPMANGGLCAIDELNLMKKEDYAALYNAMEKGFVSYDKGGKHYKFDAKIKLIATANPSGDKFKSYDLEQVKKQLPFDSALLSRFHLTFLVKRVSLERFAEIAEKLISEDKIKAKKNDVLFIKRYIRYANKLDPKLPNALAEKVKKFVTDLKEKEDQLPFEITPRTVIGITRLLKASARIDLRNEIEAKDLDRVFSVIAKTY
ncbi:MAG: ATP-binding protein [Candidatus Nanoarchaeia archaeon]